MRVHLLAPLKAGLLAGLAAALINAMLFFFFRQAGVITDSILLPNHQPMTVAPILLSSLIPALLGSVVYYLLARFTKDGYRNFTIIAIVLLILSFVNPFFGIPGVTVAYALTLNVMHVVVVAALLYALRKFTGTAPDPVKP